MKKLLLLISIFATTIVVNAQIINYEKVEFSFKNHPNEKDKLSFNEDGIEFNFTPSYGYMKAHIYNKSGKKAIIKWDAGVIELTHRSGKIVFGDDNQMTMDRAKSDEILYPNSSVSKNLISRIQVEHSDGLYSNIMLKLRKDGGNVGNMSIIIPVEIDGVTKEYRADIDMTYLGKKYKPNKK